MMTETICPAFFVRRSIYKKSITCIFTALWLSLCASYLHATPLPLSDNELDSISAGYVLLTLTSNATATGEDTVTIAVTDSSVNSRRGPRGRTRTVSRGSSLSQAIGDVVSTETGYSLDTDEQILSANIVQRIRNSENGTTVIRVRINRRGQVTVRTRERPANGRNRNNNRNNRVTETNTLSVRVVTSTNNRNRR